MERLCIPYRKCIIRKLVALVTMECETEDACNVELFWDCFNEVLWKEKKDGSYFF